jgi:flagellar hook-associated protein 1 FlgK
MSIFSIGASGLSAAQTALETTSNNISNVHTPGYNREITLQRDSAVAGGTYVTDVQRQFNHFTASQLNEAVSGEKYFEAYEVQIKGMDNLLADQDSGLSALMQDFFSALSDLAAAPADPAARQGVLATADTLTAQFRSIDGYLADTHRNVNSQIDSEIESVNNTSALIARLNNEIVVARAKTGAEPNSLLNQRDQLVTELSENLNVKVLRQSNGTYNVTLGNGQPLVSGSESYALRSIDSSSEPARRVVGYQDAAGNVLELSEGAFSGGKLAGLMDFRSQNLDSVRDKIGRLAVSLAGAFNEQHRAGRDLNGDDGVDFFSIGDPLVFSNSRNSGSAGFTAAFIATDTESLSGTSYELRVSNAAAGEFEVFRADGMSLATATLDGANQLTLDGVVLTLDDPAMLADGDRFTLQPTRHAAGRLEVVVNDISQIAAADALPLGADPDDYRISGDNRNAIALQDLQLERIVGGSADLGQGYASIVSEVGNQTNITQINNAAQAGIKQQVRALQQSESGVNLDEEAANLVRYQQYYQANARVIEVGSVIIDQLLNLR